MSQMYMQGEAMRMFAAVAPMFQVDKKNRLHFAPISWLNSGINTAADGIGKTLLNIHLRRTGDTVSTRNLGLNIMRRMGLAFTDRRRQSGFGVIIAAAVLWAIVMGLADTVINYLGLGAAYAAALRSMRGLGDSLRYGSGWADGRYLDSQRLTGFSKYSRLWIGRTVGSASGLWQGGKIVIGAGIRGLAVYGVAQLLGADPTVALGLGITYGTVHGIRNILHNPRFAGQWDPLSRKYISGGFSRGEMLEEGTTRVIGNPSFLNRVGTRIFGGRFTQFVQAYNTPIDEFGRILHNGNSIGWRMRLGVTA